MINVYIKQDRFTSGRIIRNAFLELFVCQALKPL